MKRKARANKSAAKRFKITATGKVLHRGHGFGHLKTNKSKRRLRSLRQLKEAMGVYKTKVKKILSI